MEFNLSILKKWSTYLDSQMPKLFFRQEYNNFAKTFMLLKKVLASLQRYVEGIGFAKSNNNAVVVG